MVVHEDEDRLLSDLKLGPYKFVERRETAPEAAQDGLSGQPRGMTMAISYLT